MDLLLDTHVFIWWTINPEKLSSKVIDLMSNEKNNLFLSIASVWEMQIKINIGKLHFDESLSEIVNSQREINSIKILPIDLKHIWQLNNLLFFHKDPFDRMLITQSMIENITIVSVDRIFNQYSIDIIW